MAKKQKLLATLAVLVCLTALGLYGNPFPTKAAPAYIHCSIDHGPHIELADEAADTITAGFRNLRLSWFPEPQKANLYLPQHEKQYVNLVLGKAAFLHLFVLEDGSLRAYAAPWGSRTYKVLNPEALAPLVPLLNQSVASPSPR